MRSAERVGIWFVVAALAGMTFILWAATNKRIDELAPPAPVVGRAATTTTTTTTPLAAEVANLRRAVLELQASRGLTGPEVRALVETLLPTPQNPPTDEPCAEPPCVPVITPATAPPASVPGTPPTTEKRRRRAKREG